MTNDTKKEGGVPHSPFEATATPSPEVSLEAAASSSSSSEVLPGSDRVIMNDGIDAMDEEGFFGTLGDFMMKPTDDSDDDDFLGVFGDFMMKPSGDDDDGDDANDKLPQEGQRTQQTTVPSSPIFNSAGDDTTDVEKPCSDKNR